MKRKELMYLLVAAVIFVVAGYLIYTQVAPKKQAASAGVEVEKIGVIPDQLDATGLAEISDSSKVVDFNSPVDLTGLGNAAVFGP
jgi:hypothetical protein